MAKYKGNTKKGSVLDTIESNSTRITFYILLSEDKNTFKAAPKPLVYISFLTFSV